MDLYCTKSIPKHTYKLCIKKIVHATFDCSIDLFVLDVLNLFQLYYYTTNQDLQTTVEPEWKPNQISGPFRRAETMS